MNSYIEKCLTDHIEGMKHREKLFDDQIKLIGQRLDQLKEERWELEKGLDNWRKEQEDA